MTRRSDYQWAVRFRRRGYKYLQVRFFQSESAAMRLVDKLTSGGRPDLAPLVELFVERRELGPVEVTWKAGHRW